MVQSSSLNILHITNWYPNPWDEVEGNFVRAQFEVFQQVVAARLVNVQVRFDAERLLSFRSERLGPGQRGYYFLTRFGSEHLRAIFSTLLLLVVFFRERAWRYDLLHFHIAWPLMAHAHLWKFLYRGRIIISEHWSAYHFNFHLAEQSPALKRMRRPLCQGFPVIAVSEALLSDIREFAGAAARFRGYVISNVVPLRGFVPTKNHCPILFSANRWVALKDPMPMLAGLALCAEQDFDFELVIGGYGERLSEMEAFVRRSALATRTRFLGRMTKTEIAAQLARCDAYLFSSVYETFSVACAEALGAGVPLIGPFVPAIAEYAGPDDWIRVKERDAEEWSLALQNFLTAHHTDAFNGQAIAMRAARRFAPEEIKIRYRAVLDSVRPNKLTDFATEADVRQ